MQTTTTEVETVETKPISPKVKTSLCVLKSDVLALSSDGTINGIGDSKRVLDLPYFLADRSICETNLLWLQPIVYMILYDAVIDKYFIYKRGKEGNESRLHGLCSIGLGGHAEEPISVEANAISILAFSAARELHEEVGLPFTAHLVKTIENKLEHSKFFLIYDDSTAVNSVHLALAMIINVDSQTLFKEEENVIVNTNWLSKSAIIDLLKPDSEVELESWSKTALHYI